MKLSIKAGATSQTVNIWIQDKTSTAGAGLTGLVFNTSGLTAYYALPLAASVAITLATLSAVTSAYSSGGFKEIDATNMPGWYRFDIPNAAIASGRFVSIHFQLGGNMAPLPIEIELTGWDNQDAVHGGLSCLPNTGVTTNASLLTSGTGTDQISVTTGQVNLGKILGTTVSTPATAGILDVNVKNMNNVAGTAITTIKAVQGLTTADTITTCTTATNLTNAPTAGDFTATMKTSLNAATPASVVGAVGSVTGSVGSVTGLTASNLDTTVSSRLATSSYSAPPSSATIASSVLTTAMTESYVAAGGTPTLTQAMYQLVQQLGQATVSGTTQTVKKRDGTTTAKTFTINDATNPTAISETT